MTGFASTGRMKGVRIHQDKRSGHRHMHIPHHYDLGTVRGTQAALREARGLVGALTARLHDFGVGRSVPDPDSEHDSDSEEEDKEYQPRSSAVGQAPAPSQPITRSSSSRSVPMVIIPARAQRASDLRQPPVRGSGVFARFQGRHTRFPSQSDVDMREGTSGDNGEGNGNGDKE
jgi:hypothetical protein